MNDMSSVITPKSDQWNADDFLAGPRTFQIESVAINPGQEQPVSIRLVGEPRVWRPCKSMSRCLVGAWGPDAKAYIGRSLTLYCDPSITWGGMAIGGIRISHLTNIPGPQVMALTATRGNKKPFRVLPLIMPDALPSIDVAALHARASTEAEKGTASLTAFWGTLGKPERLALKDAMTSLKAVAAMKDFPVDAATSEQPDDGIKGATVGNSTRNELWSRDSFEIPLGPDGKNQLTTWAGWFAGATRDALTVDELVKLDADNAATLAIMKTKRTDLYSELRNGIKAQHTVLAGAEGA